MPTTAPYGSWRSPITSDSIVASTISFGETLVTDKYIYHSEGRPSEGGRSVICRRSREGGEAKDVFGRDYNARTRVHEYGGAAWTVVPSSDEVFFSNFSDGRIYRVLPHSQEPKAITSESTVDRFAAFVSHPSYSSNNPYLLSILEHHIPSQPTSPENSLVLINTATGKITSLQTGCDFYSNPSFSPSASSSDELSISWTQWNHPNMPWESASLRIATLSIRGGKAKEDEPSITVGNVQTIAGGEGESAVSQPKWGEDGKILYFLWDKTGFMLLWRVRIGQDGKVEGEPELLIEEGYKHDLADTDWVFGNSDYAPLSPTQILIAPLISSLSTLSILSLPSKSITPVSLPSPSDPYVSTSHITPLSSTSILFTGTTNAKPSSLVTLDLTPNSSSNPAEIPATYKTLQTSSSSSIDPGYFSAAKGLEFDVPLPNSPKPVNLNVLFYPPQNKDYSGGEDGEKPPAIVRCHGGPTSRAVPGLSWVIQYYTSRGFVWIDVNYGGSGGFGREYRERLAGQWGVVDVSDSIEAVKHCGKEGLIDPKRVAILGGSAGGFTVLAALTQSDVFAAGASSYGISDLKLLADDTHKFESQYLFKLVGGTPAQVPQIYHDRSPVYNAGNITASLLLLQGLDDKVVPPEQARTMVSTIEKAGGKVEAVYYEGEGHGFRKAENVKDSLDRTLAFFQKTFGLDQ